MWIRLIPSILYEGFGIGAKGGLEDNAHLPYYQIFVRFDILEYSQIYSHNYSAVYGRQWI